MATSFPLPTTPIRRSARHLIDRAALLLLGATPVLFALTTWDPTLGNARLQGARSFGTPVLFVELAVIAMAVAGGWTVRDALARLSTAQRVLLAGVIGIAVYTAFWVAPDRATAAARSGANLIHLVFGLALAGLLARWDGGTRRCLWPAVTAGTVAYIALLPFYMSAIADWGRHDWTEFGLTVVNVRQLGFYALTGSAAALGLAATTDDARRRLFWTAAATLCTGLSTWSGTRSSLVAVLGAVAVTALLLPRLRTRSLLTVTAVSLAGSALSSLALPMPNEMFGLWRMSASLAGEDVSSGRIEIWSETIRWITGRPLLGYGESQFRLFVESANGIYNHPHNSVLQVAFQWGLVGLACTVALAWPLLLRARRAAITAPASAAPAFLVLVAMLLMSLVEGTLYHAYPISVVALSLAYLLTIPASDPDPYRKL